MEFQIKKGDQYIELYKLLKITNLTNSGGEAKAFIANGMVKVNEKTETRKSCKIHPGDKVEFNQQIIIVTQV